MKRVKHSAKLSEIEIDMRLKEYFSDHQIMQRSDFQGITGPFVLQGETDSAVLLFYLATTQDNESLIIYSRISLQWRYNYLFNSRRRRLYFTVGLLRIYSYCE